MPYTRDGSEAEWESTPDTNSGSSVVVKSFDQVDLHARDTFGSQRFSEGNAVNWIECGFNV